MIKIFKTSKNVIVNIDEYFNHVELGILNFKQGVNHYLDGKATEFENNLNKIIELEEKSDAIIRKIENDFYYENHHQNNKNNYSENEDDSLFSEDSEENNYKNKNLKTAKNVKSNR